MKITQKIHKAEYQTKYRYLTNNSLPEDFDIHHIDGRRWNNEIKNLVALPVRLHAEYHKELNIKDSKKIDGIVKEIDKWIMYRDYLLGKSEIFDEAYKYPNQ